MRIFAWSDLHLESKVNFELVKQFCQLNKKRTDSTENSMSSGHGTANADECAIGSSTEASTGAEAPAWPPLSGTIAGNIGKLWEVVTGATSPLNEDFADDVLILAGDVHHELEGLKESLKLFCSVFGHVAFVPGNHELWITHKDRDFGITDSLQKFDSILRLCESLGIHTSPFSPSRGVRLVPLFSWYDEFDPHFRRVAVHAHQSQTVAPRTSQPRTGSSGPSPSDSNRAVSSKLLLSLAENWMDYTACRWPLPLTNNDPKSSCRQGTECSSLGRTETESTLFKRFSGMNLRMSRRCMCKFTGESNVPSVPYHGAGAADAAGRREASGLPCGSQRAVGVSCKPFHGKWCVEKAEDMPKVLLPNCSPRRFTDAWGMPLSLSEFFAIENERRGCFENKSRSPCRDTCSLGRNVQCSEGGSPASDTHDYAAVARVPESNIGHTRRSESDHSSHITNCKTDVGSSSPEGTCGQESACCEGGTVVITFSHFLPRAELAKLYPLSPGALAYVMGSTRIDEQLRQADGSMHVFGHSHVNVDHKIEGVRYIQHSLGRPSEQKWFPGRLRPKLIFSDCL